MSSRQPLSPPTSDEFALLVDAVEDYAIFLLAPDGEVRTWNRGAARIFGYSAEDIVGRSFSKFYLTDDLSAEKPRHELEVAAAEGRVEDEGWRVRGDGRRFWVNTIITALRDESGALLGFAKVTRDLTARRAADEQLRQSRELFRLLVESVQDYAIFMLDADGNVATWNAGANRIKGYAPEEIIGRHFSTFYTEEDIRNRKPERELEIAKEKGSVEDEGWRLRKDGTRFWANVLITAVFDETGELRGFAKVTRDITERKNAEELRQSLVEQREARLQAEEERRRVEASYLAAQEANRAKDEFLMTLSHELRTPMTAILGWARLLPALHPDDEMFRDAIASIGRSAKLQAQLIDEVLDVSRIMSGKLRLSRENLDVQKVLRAAVDGVRAMADARSISLTTNLDPALGVFAADPTRLQQIVWNLLTNALKFTPIGGKVELSARRTASHVEISVADSGEGIDPHFLPHVFEPFVQAENPRSRVHGGLGLGLSIVRYLVEAHGGTVSAESEGRGRGAKFSVWLPVAAINPESAVERGAQAATPEGSIDPARLKGLRVLIVDDDRETRSLVRALLRQAGADVTVADSAAAALTEFDSRVPDLLITDIAMPETDGFALTRSIRARKGGDTLKIIALSAFPAATTAAEASGFDLYLRKPIDPADLVDAAAKLTGR
ncbi:MAG TPA: PAS domain S-box protein [Thermoanaerobaculia bacterium]|nr:PAS domain S-box protein [Thermoanaerobaculia bacterium]